jgi:hypothetical protein
MHRLEHRARQRPIITMILTLGIILILRGTPQRVVLVAALGRPSEVISTAIVIENDILRPDPRTGASPSDILGHDTLIHRLLIMGQRKSANISTRIDQDHHHMDITRLHRRHL